MFTCIFIFSWKFHYDNVSNYKQWHRDRIINNDIEKLRGNSWVPGRCTLLLESRMETVFWRCQCPLNGQAMMHQRPAAESCLQHYTWSQDVAHFCLILPLFWTPDIEFIVPKWTCELQWCSIILFYWGEHWSSVSLI